MEKRNEPMLTIQGKVPRRIKERVRLLLKERQISESEFIRGITEDYLNGNAPAPPSIQSADTGLVEQKLTDLSQQVAEMRKSMAVFLEVILTNLTDQPDEVPDFVEELRQQHLI